MGTVSNQPPDILDLRESVAANAIGWVLFGSDDAEEVHVTPEQAQICMEAAKTVFAHLDRAGLYEP